MRGENKILVVDDEIDVCLTFKRMLEENGFDIDGEPKKRNKVTTPPSKYVKLWLWT
jgi:DNA-binding response OmpR family regulator